VDAGAGAAAAEVEEPEAEVPDVPADLIDDDVAVPDLDALIDPDADIEIDAEAPAET
jgi:hypothetical protein